MPPITANRLYRAYIRARRVLTLMADRGRGEAILFYHPDTRHKVRRRHRRAILLLLVRHHAGDLAGTTPDTRRRIRHNKPVHCSPPALKRQNAREPFPAALIPLRKRTNFVRCLIKPGELSYSRTVNPSSLEIACAVSRICTSSSYIAGKPVMVLRVSDWRS